jgi:hypothetical protein
VGLKIAVPSFTSTQTDHENDVDLSPATNSNTGVVREFCPGLNEYFVVFEDSSLPPAWMALHDTNNSLKDGIRVVIDWDRAVEEKYLSGDGQSPDGDSEDEDDPDVEISGNENGKHQPLDSNGMDEITPTTNDEIVSDFPPEELGTVNYHLVSPTVKVCELCGEGDENVKDCPHCRNHSCHPECMPLSKLDTKINESWRCWHCICESS